MNKNTAKAPLATTLQVAPSSLLAGEGTGMKERKLRALPKDFRYEIAERELCVEYTDSTDKRISLYGKIWSPKDGGVYPAVIACHGFNGHHTDFPVECIAFAQRGYVCYAFDFCGAQNGGLSRGRGADDYTLFTMKEDLIAAIAQIKALSNVDGSQIFLFGGSQGGLIPALAAADDGIKDQIAAIALYFPAFNIPDGWRNMPAERTAFLGYFVGAEYIETLRSLNPYDVIANYKKDVCIVWGTQDVLVPREYVEGAVKAYGKDRVDYTVIEGAGHGFGGEALKTAVEKVLTFIEARTHA
jgi:dienelactone hydrolase